MKKALLLTFLFSAFLILSCGNFQKDISIPKSAIQEMLDKKFPIDKNAVIARLTLDSPSVYFKEKNIGMKLRYYGNFLNKEITGCADFNGHLSYNRDKGAFYLTDFNIADIAVNDANFSNKEKLRAVVLKILNNYLDDYPVYRLDQKDFKHNLAKLMLKDLTIVGESFVITLGI